MAVRYSVCCEQHVSPWVLNGIPVDLCSCCRRPVDQWYTLEHDDDYDPVLEINLLMSYCAENRWYSIAADLKELRSAIKRKKDVQFVERVERMVLGG